MDRKLYYLLWTLISGLLACLFIYTEYAAISAAIDTGELKYVFSKYNAVMTGNAAVFAHIGNVIFGALATFLAFDSFGKYQRYGH